MPANKMKGLLKGLRYISQVFDNEKEPEMQIGHPTDVKHVAHIGCDTQSVNPPSWMNEFNSPSSYSGPLPGEGEIRENGSAKWTPEGMLARRNGLPPASPSQDMLEVPRSSTGSPRKSKSDKTKTSRRSKTSQAKDSTPGSQSPTPNPLEGSKKSRRKKTKEGGSTRSSSRPKPEACDGYACAYSDPGPASDDLPPLRSPLKSYGGEHKNNYF